MTLRKVSHTPVHNGPAAWSEILGPATARAVFAGAISCDVALVGAGFAGLSAARRLRQISPDAKIIILEAVQVAEGAAGRNSGFMIDLPHDLTSNDYASGEGRDKLLTRLNRYAIDWAGEAVLDYAIPYGFFCRVGKVNGAASDVGLRANASYAAHLQSLGEPHELLDAGAMREITGTGYYQGGLFTPGTAMIQPAGYIRGLAEGLESNGVTIFERSPVLRFESTGAGWRLETAGGTLSASRVILANNGHLESFGFRQGHLMHIMLNACMTQELSEEQVRKLGGQECWGVTPSDPMGTTVRRIGKAQGGNRVVIRQGGCYRPDMRTSLADLKRLEGKMRGKFDARFLQLTGLPFQYSWSGHLCLSKNGVSVMRELEPGLFSACVCNGLAGSRLTEQQDAAARPEHAFSQMTASEREVHPRFCSLSCRVDSRGNRIRRLTGWRTGQDKDENWEIVLTR